MVHNVVNFCIFCLSLPANQINMSKTFIYGKSVEGENFTDRTKETKRLVQNFEEGLNTIIISPRRMGKTSLVKKVKSIIANPEVKVVFMDVYDCRSEYDFLNRFASVLMKETAGRSDRLLDTIKEFLIRLTPKISFSPDPNTDFSLSLGISPQNYQPEEILNLPEEIAQKRGLRLVVCIDEFQQIGEFPDSLTFQKRLRGIWQHHQNVAYCMFGSKKHMMTRIFQNKRMPFYQFGEITFLDKIPCSEWVPFIIARFAKKDKVISEEYACRICETVDCYSSYVQQLAWNVLLETDNEVDEECFQEGVMALIEQNSGLFTSMIEGLTSYQMNFLRAVCSGYHTDFTSKSLNAVYDLGAKSNVARIKTALIDKEIIDSVKKEIHIADPVFKLWFSRNCM